MNLHIKTDMNYDMLVSITDQNDNSKNIMLKANETLNVYIEGTFACVRFEEKRKETFIGRFLLGLVEFIMQYIFYCISYEEFNFTDVKSDAVSTAIKTTSNDAEVYVNYKEIALNDISNINIGTVKYNNCIETIDYCLDVEMFRHDFKQWERKKMLILLPGLSVLVIGIVFCIKEFIIGAIILIGILLICIYLIINQAKKGQRYVSQVLALWERWINNLNEFAE